MALVFDMEITIDIDRLRSDLEDYYGTDNDDMVLIYKYDDESILCVIYDSENDTEF